MEVSDHQMMIPFLADVGHDMVHLITQALYSDNVLPMTR